MLAYSEVNEVAKAKSKMMDLTRINQIMNQNFWKIITDTALGLPVIKALNDKAYS